MNGEKPNVKPMFAGIQLTLLAIFLQLLSFDMFLELSILLAVAGTAVVAIAIKR